jgi:hypothetical protein
MRLSRQNSLLPFGVAIGAAVGAATHRMGLWVAIGAAVGAALTGIARRRGRR